MPHEKSHFKVGCRIHISPVTSAISLWIQTWNLTIKSAQSGCSYPDFWERWKDVRLVLPYFSLWWRVEWCVNMWCFSEVSGKYPTSNHDLNWRTWANYFPIGFFLPPLPPIYGLIADLKSQFGNVLKAVTLIVLTCSIFARKIMK